MIGEHPGDRTVFLGYSEPSEIPVDWVPTRQLSASLRVRVGDPAAEKNSKEMVVAGEKVRDGEWEPNLGGCNGLSAVASLPYIDYKNIWVIGVAHIILLGLVPDFMKAILPHRIGRRTDLPAYVLSQERRKVIKDRFAAIHMPSGRPRPLCIIDERGSFDMSHWWMHVK